MGTWLILSRLFVVQRITRAPRWPWSSCFAAMSSFRHLKASESISKHVSAANTKITYVFSCSIDVTRCKRDVTALGASIWQLWLPTVLLLCLHLGRPLGTRGLVKHQPGVSAKLDKRWVKESYTNDRRRFACKLLIKQKASSACCMCSIRCLASCRQPHQGTKGSGNRDSPYDSDSVSPKPKQIFKPSLQHHLLLHLFRPSILRSILHVP